MKCHHLPPSSLHYQRIDLTLPFTTKHANIRALPQIYHGEERPGNLVTNYQTMEPPVASLVPRPFLYATQRV